MKRIHVGRAVSLVAIVVALCAGSIHAQPSQLTVEELRDAIRKVATTNDLREATSVYAAVATRAGRSKELHEVFMRKMLEMDLPHRAGGAARALVKIERDNGLAWAVLGYYDTNNDQVPRGFQETVIAAPLLPHDDNILYNLGQAASWYDIEGPKTRFDSNAVGSLEQHRALWSQNGAFQEGYNRIQEGNEHHEGLIADVEDEIEEIDAEVQDLTDRHGELEDEIADVRATIEDLERILYLRYGAREWELYSGTPGNDMLAIFKLLGEAQKLWIQLVSEKEDVEYRIGMLGLDREENERKIRVLKREKVKNFRRVDAWLDFRPPTYDRSQSVLAGIDLAGVSESDIVVINYGTLDLGQEEEDDREDEFLAWWDDHSDVEAAAAGADPAYDEAAAVKMLHEANRRLDRHEIGTARALLEQIVSKHGKTQTAQKAKQLLQGLSGV